MTPAAASGGNGGDGDDDGGDDDGGDGGDGSGGDEGVCRRHGSYNRLMDISLAELEQAINHWRALRPSRGEERALSTEVNALANVYALMIFERRRSIALDSLAPAARQLLEDWLRQQAQTGA